MLSLSCAVADAAGSGDHVEFNRDVRPILSDTCFKCHGFDKNSRKADLRLDIPAEAFAKHKKITPIVPGKPLESEVFRRMMTDNPDDLMPPPKSNLSLTPAQRDTIKRWIEQGAVYQPHWAFIPPKTPAVPTVKNAAWVRNPVDAFILAKLEHEGIAPSPEADKATLIRRVCLDLTGLPPTPAEVAAFVSDSSPQAYENLVDRLLKSPRYGERMAIDWLDAARYADSNGFQGDRDRTMWPWRDWVIHALNSNMPFDRFTVEQIAGDLLPGSTVSQKIATGFNRNHMLNGEGGRIAEESRVDYVMDRVETTGTVWLGLTIGCCRCHDHKYDPLLQKDYYQFYSFFNNVAESGAVDAGGNANPVMRIVREKDDAGLIALRENLAAAEADLASQQSQIDSGQAAWEKSVTPVEWTVADIATFKSEGGATFKMLPDKSLLVSGANPVTDVHEVTLRTDQVELRSLRLEAMRDPSLTEGGPGRALDHGNFVLDTIEAQAVSVADPKLVKKIIFATAHADYSQPGWDVVGAIDKDPKTGWAVFGTKVTRTAQFTFAEPVGFPGGTELRFRFHYQTSNRNHSMGRFRLSLTSGTALPPDIASILHTPADDRNDTQKKLLNDYYRSSVDASSRDLIAAVAAAKRRLEDYEKSQPLTMVMQELPKPRPAHILIRGVWDKPGEAVTANTPGFLPPLPAGATANRLALAQWLVDPANPLTARVTVNRYWQTFFGIGLVKTSEDFGVQGEPPSHPDLLDWLATHFIAEKWDVKAMHRLIVTSAAYRQSSRVTPELLERDPANRLLARGPRYRLSSSAIRDQALLLSGMLVERVGGPPVRPYQPAGVWEDATFGTIKYQQGHGEDLYRRSIYTFWRRIVAPTEMFDTSNRNVCTVRLPRTNTPLQALVLMNDVTYLEAARNLAQRVMLAAGPAPEMRLALAFRTATGRAPTDPELRILANGLQRELIRYRADTTAAMKILSHGESPRDPKLDPAELAAYTAVVSTILNLDEVVTKE